MKRCFSWLLLLMLLANSCLASPLVKPVPAASTAGMNLQVQGHISGVAMAVALWDHYALLGFSFELAVLDLAVPAHPQWLTALPLPTNDIVLYAGYAYVVGRTGFTVVDIHDPRQPVVVSGLSLPATPSQLAVTTDYAYVAIYGDLYTIALADRTRPTVVSVTPLAIRITGVAAVADDVYVVSNAGLARLTMSDPALPVSHWLLTNEHLSYGPLLVDGVLYVGGKTLLWSKELASTTPPCVLAVHTSLDTILDMAIVNGVAYVAGSFQGLQVWDLRQPPTVRQIGAYPTAGLLTVVVAHGNYLYTVDGDEGLRLFDATNPHELIPLTAFTPLGISYEIAVSGAFAYVAGGFSGGLHQLVLTNPSQTHMIYTHLTQSAVHGLAVVDDHLYFTVATGVGVIDLAIPTTPHRSAFYLLPGAYGLKATASSLYVSDLDGNILLLERMDPEQLTPIALYPRLGYAHGMAVAGQLACIAHQEIGMRLLTISATGELTPVGIYRVNTLIHKILVAGSYAYLALGKAGVAVVDISDPTTPQLVSRYDTPGDVRDLALQGSYLLAADGPGGLRVLDIREPLHLVEVASYQSCDGAYEVVSVDGVIYVMQPLGGLWLLRLTADGLVALSFGVDPIKGLPGSVLAR